MTLDARVRVEREGFTVDIDLAAGDGEIVAVVGPNGGGKTTALHAVAGLVPLDDGWVTVDGVDVERPATGRWEPAHVRRIGLVFQDARLFPHLDVIENVAFGAAAADRRARRVVASGWLDRLGLVDRATASPRALSAGETQRVAIARALAAEPRLMLLDEPFASADVTSRRMLRRTVREHGTDTGIATVLVTHDPVEAIMLGDRVVVVVGGRVIQTGTPAELARHPRDRFVADVVGINLFVGEGVGSAIRLRDGRLVATAVSDLGGEVTATLHPRAVAVHAHEPEGSPRNVWSARVEELSRDGERVRVRVAASGLGVLADVTASAVAELGLAPGVDVWVSFKASEVELHRD